MQPLLEYELIRRCLFTLLIVCESAFHLLPAPTTAQVETEQSSYWQSRYAAESEFQSALKNQIKKCDTANAELLSRFLIDRDPQRQYIFIPPENKIDSDRLSELPEEIKTEVDQLLQSHADKLLELAKQEADSGNAAWALQLINEILFYQPNHQEVRKILGHRVNESGEKTWRVKSDRLRVKRSTKPEKDLGWAAKSYWIGKTTHFQIVSTAGEQQTRELAMKLERWHDVWRQVFFEYNNSQKNLNRWIQGTSKPVRSGRKFDVVFFADRNQYISTLQPLIPGIEASTGYYNDAEKRSYFFASKESTIRDTWRHELTHQMFQESQRSVATPFKDQFLWLGEGIAMYFESLVDHGDFVTLGGVETRRLQYARLRRLKEQFRLPLQTLSTMSIRQFQTQPDIAKIYSQSAGVSHYLMNGNDAKLQRSTIEFLQLIYSGKLKTGSFEKVLGQSFSQIESGYQSYLKIKPEDLMHLDPHGVSQELALIGLRLKDDSLVRLADVSELDWLDLSACDVRGKRLEPLTSIKKIDSLFLTGAKIDLKAANILAEVPVASIDLSGSNLKDEGLIALAKSKTLRTINVIETNVTSHGLKTLASSRPDIRIRSNFTR